AGIRTIRSRWSHIRSAASRRPSCGPARRRRCRRCWRSSPAAGEPGILSSKEALMRHTIALIPGDGIGKEVVPAAARVLDAAGKKFGFDFAWTTFDWSCETYARTGRMMPEDGLDQLRAFEAIFLGAVGFPGVPDHISLWGLLIPIRRGFHQYINLRPVRLLEHVTSATKSNGIIHSMPYWDERFAAMAKAYPSVKTAQYHIDILTAHFVQHPDWFDVVVGSNLFGDILSDLGPAIAGSIGIAPGGNINPEKEYPSMFEPVHGSAPDIAGKNIANPIAQ